MNILSMTLNNFLTIGEGRIDLCDRGLLLVQGENRDNTSANSNGAGKSSIVDGLCWCFYGVTARGISGDAVVNKTAKKGCKVEAYIDDNGRFYRVARHRKHSTAKNALHVFEVDQHGKEITNLTKGTDKETQAFLTTLIGSTLEVFMSSVYAGQEAMPNLPALTDKNLKVLIEEASGIQVLEKAHNIAKDRLNKAKAIVNNLTIHQSNAVAMASNLEVQLSSAKAKSDDFNSTKKDRSRAKLEESQPYKLEIKRLHDQHITGVKREDLEANVAKCRQAADNLEQNQRKAKLLEKARTDLGVGLAIINNNTASLKDRYIKLTVDIKGLDSLVGTPCKECGKGYCADDLHQARQARLEQVESIKGEYAAIKAKTAEAQEKLAQAEADLNAFLAENPVDAREAYSALREAENKLTAFDNAQATINSHLRAVDNIINEARAMLLEQDPFEDMINTLTANHASAVANLDELSQKLTKATAELELCEQAVLIYGPSGVRAHILDTVTPFLNQRTSEYLGALTDGNTTAVWSTLSKNAKGELKEKFTIDVSDVTGAECFDGLSGGEKRKVRLATALALQDLVASRATKPINLFIGDEIDDALDSSGLERLMSVLERKSRDRGTVLVVSHSELRDWIDDVVLVVKENGYSSLNGANTR